MWHHGLGPCMRMPVMSAPTCLGSRAVWNGEQPPACDPTSPSGETETIGRVIRSISVTNSSSTSLHIVRHSQQSSRVHAIEGL